MPVTRDSCAFLDARHRAVREPVPAVVGLDRLGGQRQGDSPAGSLEGLALQADFGEQRDLVFLHLRGKRRAAVKGGLNLVVAELGHGADGGQLDPRPRELAGGVEVVVPEVGGALFAGKQGRGAVRKDLGVEGNRAVGSVKGLPAAVGFPVQRPARLNERSDGGDGVSKEVAVAFALDEERLVEVERAGRIDRGEGDVAPVDEARPEIGVVFPPRGCAFGVGCGLRGEAGCNSELFPQCGEGSGDRAGSGDVRFDETLWH